MNRFEDVRNPKDKLLEYVFTGNHEAIDRLSEFEVRRSIIGIEADIGQKLFHTTKSIPGGVSRDDKSITDVIKTFEILQKKGFVLSMNHILSCYDAILASRESKDLVMGFVVYYRNHPKFLYKNITPKSKENAQKILRRILEKVVNEDHPKWYQISIESAKSALDYEILSKEEFIAIKHDLILKALDKGVILIKHIVRKTPLKVLVMNHCNCNDDSSLLLQISPLGENNTSRIKPILCARRLSIKSLDNLSALETCVLFGDFERINSMEAIIGEHSLSKIDYLLFYAKEDRSLANLMSTFAALQNKGIGICMNNVFSHYDSSTPELQSVIRGFLIYYRNNPKFLYGNLSIENIPIAKTILSQICEEFFENSRLKWYEISSELLRGAYEERIINREEYFEKRWPLVREGIKKDIISLAKLVNNIPLEILIDRHCKSDLEFPKLPLVEISKPGENFSAAASPLLIPRRLSLESVSSGSPVGTGSPKGFYGSPPFSPSGRGISPLFLERPALSPPPRPLRRPSAENLMHLHGAGAGAGLR
jgi:hypothetical protein